MICFVCFDENYCFFCSIKLGGYALCIRNLEEANGAILQLWDDSIGLMYANESSSHEHGSDVSAYVGEREVFLGLVRLRSYMRSLIRDYACPSDTPTICSQARVLRNMEEQVRCFPKCKSRAFCRFAKSGNTVPT